MLNSWPFWLCVCYDTYPPLVQSARKGFLIMIIILLLLRTVQHSVSISGEECTE